ALSPCLCLGSRRSRSPLCLGACPYHSPSECSAKRCFELGARHSPRAGRSRNASCPSGTVAAGTGIEPAPLGHTCQLRGTVTLVHAFASQIRTFHAQMV